MAIGYDSCIGGCTGYTTQYTLGGLTVGTEPNRILLVGIKGTGVTSVTWGGVALTQLLGPGGLTGFMYYLVNPASGPANIVAQGGSNRWGMIGMAFYGVDQVNPFRDSAMANNSATVLTQALTCEIGDMLVAFAASNTATNFTAVAGQSGLACYTECSYTSAGGDTAIGEYYKVASASPDSISLERATSSANQILAAAMRPYIPALGRSVKYYFNIWDPRAAVRDRNDRIVPPNELTADAWVEVQGHIVPDPSAYDTYINDPTKARIVEVTAGEQGATLRANRSQFADVLISRASAGRA